MASLDRYSSASLSVARALSSTLDNAASITASRSCSLAVALESMTEIVSITKQLSAGLQAIPDVEQVQVSGRDAVTLVDHQRRAALACSTASQHHQRLTDMCLPLHPTAGLVICRAGCQGQWHPRADHPPGPDAAPGSSSGGRRNRQPAHL